MRPLACLALAAILSSSGRASADDAVSLAPAERRAVTYSDGFVIQNDWALVRLYPRASLAVDLRGTAGSGAADVRGVDGSPELSPRVVLRRGLLEIGGGALGFFDMKLGVELDGRGTFGDPLLPDAHALKVGIPNAWVSTEAGPSFNVMAGIQPTPFSLERRTDPDDLASLEPSIASQLAVPFARAIGVTMWGTSLHRQFGYDLMGITAVGNTIPQSFAERGGAGRAFFRPFALSDDSWSRLQIGVSARWTVRDGQAAEVSRDDLTTGNGFALFRRRFVDSLGRTEAILASGAQRGLGVEAVSPLFTGFTITGEVYVFADDTREAVESVAATHTERLGSLSGAGWYAQASYLLDPIYHERRRWSTTHDVPYSLSRSLDGGLYPHPRRHDPVGVQSPIESLTSLQFTLRAGRVDAAYHPTRGSQPALYGQPDAASPGGRVDVWELGGTVSVWCTRIFRVSAAWQSYFAPDAGSASSRTTLAAQAAGVADAHWMHELSLRARMAL